MSDESKPIEDMTDAERLEAIAKGIPHVVSCLDRLYRLMPDTVQCSRVTGWVNKSLMNAKVAESEWKTVQAERAEAERAVLPPTGTTGDLPPEEPVEHEEGPEG